MIVLTRRFNSIYVGGMCIRVVKEAVVWSAERCSNSYLLYSPSRGFWPSQRPPSEDADVYIAAGRPRKIEFGRGVEVRDGLNLFNGFVKKGLWREVAPSFHAALADYVSKSIYHTIEMTIRGRVNRLVRESGFYMAVERRGGYSHVLIIATPGRGQLFREVAAEVFNKAEAIKKVHLGVAVDTPLDIYLSHSKYSTPQRGVKPLLLTLATNTTP